MPDSSPPFIYFCEYRVNSDLNNKLSALSKTHEDLSETAEARYEELRDRFDRQKRTTDALIKVKNEYEDRLAKRKQKLTTLTRELAVLKQGKGKGRELEIIDLEDEGFGIPSAISTPSTSANISTTHHPAYQLLSEDVMQEDEALRIEGHPNAQLNNAQSQDAFADIDAAFPYTTLRPLRDPLAEWSNSSSINKRTSTADKRDRQASGSEKWIDMAIKGNAKAGGARKKPKLVF